MLKFQEAHKHITNELEGQQGLSPHLSTLPSLPFGDFSSSFSALQCCPAAHFGLSPEEQHGDGTNLCISLGPTFTGKPLLSHIPSRMETEIKMRLLPVDDLMSSLLPWSSPPPYPEVRINQTFLGGGGWWMGERLRRRRYIYL